MKNDYSQAIPPAWQAMSRIFVALGDEHRQRILLLFEPGERLNVGDGELVVRGFWVAIANFVPLSLGELGLQFDNAISCLTCRFPIAPSSELPHLGDVLAVGAQDVSEFLIEVEVAIRQSDAGLPDIEKLLSRFLIVLMNKCSDGGADAPPIELTEQARQICRLA